jgi:hypothetical protein
MSAGYVVVAGWGAGLVVLALILIGYWPFDLTTGPLPFLLLVAAGLVVATFAAVVLVAVRRDRVGVQRRQPRRAGLAVCAAVALAVALLGFALDWWMTLFALYAVLMAAVLVRGDRAPREVAPLGATTAAPPASPTVVVHDGGGPGEAEAVSVARVLEDQLGPPSPRLRRFARAAVIPLVWRALRRRGGPRP